jgi:hypothetical protein
VDPSVGDLHLQPASPLRNIGAPPTRCMTFDGVQRTQTPDLGAY